MARSAVQQRGSDADGSRHVSKAKGEKADPREGSPAKPRTTGTTRPGELNLDAVKEKAAKAQKAAAPKGEKKARESDTGVGSGSDMDLPGQLPGRIPSSDAPNPRHSSGGEPQNSDQGAHGWSSTRSV
jgi:hypothetical protein